MNKAIAIAELIESSRARITDILNWRTGEVIRVQINTFNDSLVCQMCALGAIAVAHNGFSDEQLRDFENRQKLQLEAYTPEDDIHSAALEAIASYLVRSGLTGYAKDARGIGVENIVDMIFDFNDDYANANGDWRGPNGVREVTHAKVLGLFDQVAADLRNGINWHESGVFA